MSQDMEEIWSTLRQSGIVQGGSPEIEKLESPWYVKSILAFSGWLAALFILFFIGLGFQFIIKSSMASFVTGGLMIVAAYAFLRIARNEFFEHLALAISFAGQVLVIFAIFKGDSYREVTPWLGIVLMQTLLAVLMPNFVHRVCSAYFAVLALSMVLALVQFKGSALFGLGGTMGWDFMHKQPEMWGQLWMGEVFSSLVMLYLVWQLLQRSGQCLSDRVAVAALFGTLLLCVISMQAQGISTGVMILILGFAGSNRVLIGLGIVSLLFFISSYYYLLETTLLMKAQVLLITGVVLLSLRWVLLRVLLEKEGVQDEQ